MLLCRRGFKQKASFDRLFGFKGSLGRGLEAVFNELKDQRNSELSDLSRKLQSYFGTDNLETTIPKLEQLLYYHFNS